MERLTKDKAQQDSKNKRNREAQLERLHRDNAWKLVIETIDKEIEFYKEELMKVDDLNVLYAYQYTINTLIKLKKSI